MQKRGFHYEDLCLVQLEHSAQQVRHHLTLEVVLDHLHLHRLVTYHYHKYALNHSIVLRALLHQPAQVSSQLDFIHRLVYVVHAPLVHPVQSLVLLIQYHVHQAHSEGQ